MQINFELSPRDVEYFRNLLRDAASSAKDLDEAKVLDAADALLVDVERARPPSFVGERMAALRGMIDMMRDTEFALAPEFRGSVVTALAYFAEPQDLIPDDVPGLGFLDDAIMVEIVRRELQPEIEAYADFCRVRTEGSQSPSAPQAYTELIDRKRLKLFEQIRERRDNFNDFG